MTDDELLSSPAWCAWCGGDCSCEDGDDDARRAPRSRPANDLRGILAAALAGAPTGADDQRMSGREMPPDIEPSTPLYLVRRHGYWFRPKAQGYTRQIGAAGLFGEAEARGYLAADGVTIHPAGELAEEARASIKRNRATIERLEAFLRAAGEPVA